MSEDKGREFEVVNHSVPRRDGRAKVSGRALYVSDVRLAGMAYAKVLRSPYAHARIVSMDTSKAEAHAGVYNVLRGDDLEGLNPYFGHAVKDHPLIAIDKVRYAGEPVAAVIAEDELTAYEALELIRVEYEELPAVMEPQESLDRTLPCCTNASSRPAPCAASRARSPRAGAPTCARSTTSSGATWTRPLPRPRRWWRTNTTSPWPMPTPWSPTWPLPRWATTA